jgi:hypothetical protein
VPSTGNGAGLADFGGSVLARIIAAPLLPASADIIIAPLFFVESLSTSCCSIPDVATVEMRASAPVSSPSAIATTPSSIAAPMPRRTHSPAPSERFIAANTRLPISNATASELPAPAA